MMAAVEDQGGGQRGANEGTSEVAFATRLSDVAPQPKKEDSPPPDGEKVAGAAIRKTLPKGDSPNDDSPNDDNGPIKKLVKFLILLGTPIVQISGILKNILGTIAGKIPDIGRFNFKDKIDTIQFPEDQILKAAGHVDELLAIIAEGVATAGKSAGGMVRSTGSAIMRNNARILKIFAALVAIGAAAEFRNGGASKLFKKAKARIREGKWARGEGGFDEIKSSGDYARAWRPSRLKYK